MSDARKLDVPSEHTFLNPGYVPDFCDHEFLRKHRASEVAHMCSALTDTIVAAFDNECVSTPLHQRGISRSLEILAAMSEDLIAETEYLENELERLKAEMQR